MRIGIDMRMAGAGEGIGRYAEALISGLAKLDRQTSFVLIFHKDSSFARTYSVPAKNFTKAYVNSRYYSLSEQIYFPLELYKLRLDLVHFASFNAPIFYFRPFVVTIHDLIHHHFPGRKKTHLIFRLGYRAVISGAIMRAKKIIAVSEFTKSEIIRQYGGYRDISGRIAVVYNGVNAKFFGRKSAETIRSVREKYNITKPYIFFVGAWRVYKNLGRLASAFAMLKKDYGRDIQLVLAGKPDPYHPEVRKRIFSNRYVRDIIAPGQIRDEELAALYQGAEIFALSSLLEGFGLIGVEAQASGTVVAASDIPVLQEVLGEGALYFDPHSVEEIARTLNLVFIDSSLTEKIRQSGLENAHRFNWADTANETLKIYRDIRQ